MASGLVGVFSNVRPAERSGYRRHPFACSFRRPTSQLVTALVSFMLRSPTFSNSVAALAVTGGSERGHLPPAWDAPDIAAW